ncbi:TetR/AcrR family transcriptional regulator [Skermania sp. ID1734]|uniref:TetR/AcrR family transcriptional regulator n=1 Tax=Skermania sp. ID1734 TaxID=2597516 RepID=UPI0011804887|nr:TetR/AcrR family transcriptional regulator [Skermania sp. ID1734]TSE00272.1 TetR/AcrR family transcriptional regulator [Skermania sp. ID1734]
MTVETAEMGLSSARARLPHGPHRLTRAEVAESQRRRLYSAMLEAVAERGYNAVTVADLVARAQISRRTFYELFDSKEECFAASFEVIIKIVPRRLTAAIRSAGQLEWRDLIRASLAAYLDFLAKEPAIARALHIEALMAGPSLVDYRKRMMAIFADRMRDARDIAVRHGQLTGQLPDEVYAFLIGGIDDRIRDCLQTHGPSALPALEPSLTSIASTLLANGGDLNTP